MIDTTLNVFRGRAWEVLPLHLHTMADAKRRNLERLPTVEEDWIAKVEQRYKLRPSLEVTEGGVGIIPIAGTLMQNPDVIDFLFLQAVDYKDVQRMVTEAHVRDDVKAVVLSINSPGGMSCGAIETAEMVRSLAADKQVVAHTDDDMCSAAYKIGCAAGDVHCTASARLGSVGSVIAFFDVSKFYESMGAELNIFRSGDLKAAGWPGESLSEEQAASFQEQVERGGAAFVEFVEQMRREVPEDMARGGTYYGDQAVDNGLADAISSLEETIADLEAFAELEV